MDIVSLIIWIILLAVLFYAVTWVIGWMGLPEPANKIVRILVGLVLLLIILGMVTGRVPMAVIKF